MTHWRYFSVLLMSFASVFSFANQGAPISTVSWPQTITDEMKLGKRLFFDKKLSKDNQLSCASCHQFDKGGSLPVSHSKQFNGQYSRYNPSSVFNLNRDYKLGWVGHLNSAGHQLEALIGGQKVMGLSWQGMIKKLNNEPSYVKAFNKVYDRPISKETITKALVSFEMALTTPSDFDKYLKGEINAISAEAKKGFELFQGYGCIACHQGRNVGGNLLQKLGIVIPYKEVKESLPVAELGRFNVTNMGQDIQVFRVPSLRNVADSSPYLHDGSITDLKNVIRLMAKHQLGRNIPDGDVDLIEAFLQSLSGQPHPELMP